MPQMFHWELLALIDGEDWGGALSAAPVGVCGVQNLSLGSALL